MSKLVRSCLQYELVQFPHMLVVTLQRAKFERNEKFWAKFVYKLANWNGDFCSILIKNIHYFVAKQKFHILETQLFGENWFKLTWAILHSL